MDEQQLLEVPELRDGNVGRACGLETFDTRDTDANVCSLDHADVVGAVANCEQDGLLVLLDEFDDECLLQRGHTTCGLID